MSGETMWGWMSTMTRHGVPSSYHGIDEHLVDGHSPRDQLLLEGVAFERLDGRAVGSDAVGQGVVADDVRSAILLVVADWRNQPSARPATGPSHC